ncbi:hypothetical protein Bca4012_026850 [Brassica carinata]
MPGKRRAERVYLLSLSDDLLQRETELLILRNKPEQHACKDHTNQRSSVPLQQQPRISTLYKLDNNSISACNQPTKSQSILSEAKSL